jgi:DNA-binding PadR family transcriptional regulator
MRLSLFQARVLRVLLGDPHKPMAGVEIQDQTHLKGGTLYPLLETLQGKGLVTSKWERFPVGTGRIGSARRYYRLTPNGIAYSREELAKLADELRPPAHQEAS